MATYIGSQKAKWFLGSTKVKKVYRGAQKLYSSGNIVTYYVDSSTVYQEEVEEGASCLSPKTFTPTKSGWTFLGWRADKTASSSVLSSQVMGDAPVTLYAVFRATVTVTYYNNSTTASTTSGYRYYNNGNTVNPSFKLTQATKSGWTARGWSIYNGANSSVTVANGATFTQASDVTLYGMYQKTITLSYNGNGATSGSVAAQTGVRYYNSNGNTVNPTFKLAANGFTRTGCTFTKWALNGASGTQYAVGASIALAASATMYAVWYMAAKTLVSNKTLQNGYSYTRTYTSTDSGFQFYNNLGDTWGQIGGGATPAGSYVDCTFSPKIPCLGQTVTLTFGITYDGWPPKKVTSCIIVGSSVSANKTVTEPSSDTTVTETITLKLPNDGVNRSIIIRLLLNDGYVYKAGIVSLSVSASA